ncbi:MAG TPA: hypothetical protein VFY89_07755 [Ktedonobacterales bacterium]
MATAYLIEVPGVTQEQGSAILRELGLSTPPAGQILHLEGPMEGGLRVVDVWESQAAFDRFIQERLVPAVQRAGATFPATLQPKLTWPVSHVLTWPATPALA